MCVATALLTPRQRHAVHCGVAVCAAKQVELLGTGFVIGVFSHAQCGAVNALLEFGKIQSREPNRREGGADSVCRSKASPFVNTWSPVRELACFSVGNWRPPFYITGKDGNLTQAECKDACHKLAGRDDVNSHHDFLQKTQNDGYMPIRCQAYE